MLKPLLEKVLKPGVSDLHLKAGDPPFVRQLGNLAPIGTNTLRTEDIESLANSLMNDQQKDRLKKEGDIDFSLSMENVGRLRINIYRQKETLAIAIRVISAECKTFEELHLPKDTMEKLCRTMRGLILISGVTGAGKTTTLNAMINFMNENFVHNIITVEDPIEFVHPRKKSSLSQREIGKDVASFSNALRFLLRQDPDVIILGEIRTPETFQAAIEGASSGHLVIATIHSNDSLDAVDRMVNAFEFEQQPYVRLQLTNVLKAVLSQRLVQEKYGKGCYPATEILFGTLQMKKLLQAGNNSEAKFLIEKGNAYGMHTYDQDLLRMVEEGLISQQEALNNASNPNDLRIKIQSQGGTEIESK